jgi:glycosyltransferase involved in cell wall biosynthesis
VGYSILPSGSGHEADVVMPAYNEKKTIREIAGRVLADLGDITKELVIVDDGSTDGTRTFSAN